jgi:ABC-type glycerol-3-phosphate transport system substrate-binding protein
MRGIALLMLSLGLAACAAVGESTATAPSEIDGWQTPIGTPPTKAEFAALVAACQDKVKVIAENGPMAGCLADLGLRRIE